MTDEPLPPDLEVDFPLPDGLKVTTDRPYRILLISDFAGSEAGRLSGPLTGQTVEVDPDSFDELLAEARPTVSFKTSDPTVPGSVMAEVELRFSSLKDFQPAALLQQIPATRPLFDAREQIVARMRGKLTSAQLTDGIRRTATASPQLAWLADAIHWTPSATPPSPARAPAASPSTP